MASGATTSTSINRFERSISLTDLRSSSAISDAIERDLTVPADRNQYRFFLNLAKHDLVLPSLSRFDQDFRKFFFKNLVDFDLMKGLQESKCLNWCANLPKFLAVKTLADGNCLMNAASLCMWAINDRRLTLRKSVYQVLIEDCTDAFRIRWEAESKQILADHQGSLVSSSSQEQWQADWNKTVELASPRKSPETNCFSGLEEIHVFVLANVLRRSIIVVCDDVFRGNQDESLANIDMGGIYLPLLCDPVNCVKSPLVIGYQHGHFTALVTTEDGGKEIAYQNAMWQDKSGVALMKHDGAPMKIHFLLPEEKQHSEQFLHKYLQCLKVEVECPQMMDDDDPVTILVAKMEFQEPEPHLNQMFRTYFDALQAVYVQVLAEKISGMPRVGMAGTAVSSSATMNFPGHSEPCCTNHRKCHTPGCPSYATAPADFCFDCRKKKSKKCISPECTYNGLPEQDGMCSVCFARYRGVLEQRPVPSAPPLPGSQCIKKDCSNRARCCDTCYLSAMEQMKAEELTKLNHKTTLGSSSCVSTAPPRYSRQASLFCHNQDCRNELQEPENLYCNECTVKMSTNFPFGQPDIRKCGFPGCLNALSSLSSSKLCRTCISTLQTPQQLSSPGKSSSLVFTKCRVSGCTMPAVTYHGELCLEHYKKSQHIHRTEDARLKNCDDKSSEDATRCISDGCPYFGSPERNYLCSSCHAKALQELYDLNVIRKEQERAKQEWFLRNAQLSEQMAPNVSQYQFHRDLYNPSYISGMSLGCRSHSEPTSFIPRVKLPIEPVPCATQGCPNFCESGNQLCYTCLTKNEFGRSVGPRSRFASDP